MAQNSAIGLLNALLKCQNVRSIDELMEIRRYVIEICPKLLNFASHIFLDFCRQISLEKKYGGHIFYNKNEKCSNMYIILAGSITKGSLAGTTTEMPLQSDDFPLPSDSTLPSSDTNVILNIGAMFGQELAYEAVHDHGAIANGECSEEIIVATISRYSYRRASKLSQELQQQFRPFSAVKSPLHGRRSIKSRERQTDQNKKENAEIQYSKHSGLEICVYCLSSSSLERSIKDVQAASAVLSSRYDFFKGLTEDELITFCQNVEIVTAPAGTLLMYKGLPGSTAYFILQGSVDIIAHTARIPVDNKQQTSDVCIKSLSSGDLFGERALASTETSLRSATVQSSNNCKPLVMIVISHQLYGSLVSHVKIRERSDKLEVIKACMAMVNNEAEYEELFNALTNLMDYKRLPLGSIICTQGARAQTAFFIQQGELEVFRHDSATSGSSNAGLSVGNFGRGLVVGRYIFDSESFAEEVHFKETVITRSIVTLFTISKYDFFDRLNDIFKKKFRDLLRFNSFSLSKLNHQLPTEAINNLMIDVSCEWDRYKRDTLMNSHRSNTTPDSAQGKIASFFKNKSINSFSDYSSPLRSHSSFDLNKFSMSAVDPFDMSTTLGSVMSELQCIHKNHGSMSANEISLDSSALLALPRKGKLAIIRSRKIATPTDLRGLTLKESETVDAILERDLKKLNWSPNKELSAESFDDGLDSVMIDDRGEITQISITSTDDDMLPLDSPSNENGITVVQLFRDRTTESAIVNCHIRVLGSFKFLSEAKTHAENVIRYDFRSLNNDSSGFRSEFLTWHDFVGFEAIELHSSDHIFLFQANHVVSYAFTTINSFVHDLSNKKRYSESLKLDKQNFVGAVILDPKNDSSDTSHSMPSDILKNPSFMRQLKVVSKISVCRNTKKSAILVSNCDWDVPKHSTRVILPAYKWLLCQCDSMAYYSIDMQSSSGSFFVTEIDPTPTKRMDTGSRRLEMKVSRGYSDLGDQGDNRRARGNAKKLDSMARKVDNSVQTKKEKANQVQKARRAVVKMNNDLCKDELRMSRLIQRMCDVGDVALDRDQLESMRLKLQEKRVELFSRLDNVGATV